ncbi:pks15/1 [Symbiodinium microadriaticum]|nr:pks15/1 [Symbiodinium microadriaticum]
MAEVDALAEAGGGMTPKHAVNEAKVSQYPPTDFDTEPDWCATARELLLNDQADKALKLADRGLRAAVKAKDKRNEARARQMQALVLNELAQQDPMDIVEVTTSAAKALKVAGDPRGELWTLRLQALLLCEVLKFEESLAVVKRMQVLASESGHSDQEAMAELTHAEVCVAVGLPRYAEGKDAANVALRLYGRTSDRCGQGVCQLALSDLTRLDGDADESFQAATRAQNLFHGAEDRERLPVSREISGPAGALCRKAQAMLELAEDIEALRAAEKAVNLCHLSFRKAWEAQALVVLAKAKLVVCEEGDINHTIVKVTQLAAERVAQQRPHHRVLMAEALLTMSLALIRSEGLRSALQAARDAQVFFSKAGQASRAARAQLALAEAEVGLGRATQAKEDAEEAAKILKEIEDFNGQDRALDILDAAHQALGLPTRADIAAEEQRKRQEKLRLQQQQWALQYYQQQQQGGGGAPPPMMPQMMPSMEMQAAPRASSVEKAPIERESSPLLLQAGMDSGTIKSKVNQIASAIMGSDEDFEADTPLMEAGLTSNTAVLLRDELTKDLPGIKLPPTLIFDYPSVAAITEFVMDQSKMIAG